MGVGYTVVIYYPYNGSSPRSRLPTGVNVAAERRYYDLGALLWFMEAWYWEDRGYRDSYFYAEKSPSIHPKAPAIYLIIPPPTQAGPSIAPDGGSTDGHVDRRYLVTAPLILAPMLFLLSPLMLVMSVNAQPINYASITMDEANAVNTPIATISIDQLNREFT